MTPAQPASLRDTLGLRRGEMVAFVGAGGKTTTLIRLLVELRAAGRTVLTTSTVHLFELKGVTPHPFVVEDDLAVLQAQLPSLLAEAGHVRVAAERIRIDKIRGLDPGQVAALKGLPGLDHLLVEADGARHRSLKAPAPHEPALPAGVDVLLIVTGLDAIGRPLDEAHVHRLEQVMAITGLAAGALVTPGAVAQVLTSPAGGMKGVAPATRCWVVATKYTPATAAVARELAAAVLAAGIPQIAGVILLGPAPIDELAGAPLVALTAGSGSGA
ncbi:MAG TPA: selenium cofactor biosynthesis protein YqeC [Chloroflexia bacterium]|nr:selenium cofactor biosynthesis protein YqeC [Chloroflexia bacterium]